MICQVLRAARHAFSMLERKAIHTPLYRVTSSGAVVREGGRQRWPFGAVRKDGLLTSGAGVTGKQAGQAHASHYVQDEPLRDEGSTHTMQPSSASV